MPVVELDVELVVEAGKQAQGPLRAVIACTDPHGATPRRGQSEPC